MLTEVPEINDNMSIERESFASRSISLPRPGPIKDEYYFNLFLALASSPKRLLNFIKYKLFKNHRGLKIPFLPVVLDLEPASRCNFHCTMCPVSEWPKFKRAGDMSFEDFKKTLDSMYGVVEIKIQGLGEPLLIRDTLFQMIQYARARFIWTRTTVNGSLLHLNENYKKLIDSGVNEVQISFDGASKDSFEKIRRGSIFEKIVENCSLINRYAEEKGVLRTRMWVLIQQHNVHEFLDFIPLAAKMGFKRLTYSLNLHGWGIEKLAEANDKATAEQKVTDEDCFEAVKRGKALGLEVTFWRSADKYKTESKSSLCGWPFERMLISSDMRIVPCCMITNPDVYQIGSAKNLAEQWNSTQYQEFRRLHLDGNIPKVCQMCYERK